MKKEEICTAINFTGIAIIQNRFENSKAFGLSGPGRGIAAAAAPPAEGIATHPDIESQVIQSVNKPKWKKAGLFFEHLIKNQRVELG